MSNKPSQSALEGSSAPSTQIQIPEILKEINKEIKAIKKIYKKYSIKLYKIAKINNSEIRNKKLNELKNELVSKLSKIGYELVFIDEQGNVKIQLHGIYKKLNHNVLESIKMDIWVNSYIKIANIIRKWFYFVDDFATIYDGIEYVAVLYNKYYLVFEKHESNFVEGYRTRTLERISKAEFINLIRGEEI
jgi:hypothetical protein